jgi:hypothetical protein
VEARVSGQPIPHLFVAVGGQLGKLGQAAPGVLTPNTASRLNGLLAWSTPRVRAGMEAFYGKNDSAKIVTGASPEDSALGVSGFGSVQLAAALKPTLFARVDWVRPSREVNPDLADLYLDAGLEITPWEPLRVALVYKRDHASTGALPGAVSTSNGAFGSAAPDSGGTYNEVGVFTQLSF